MSFISESTAGTGSHQAAAPYVPSAETRAAAERIMDRCETLAGISAMEGGILRAYLTEEHRRHNQQAAVWMSEAGMKTWQDAAGNQCARLEGREEGLPALLIGSHLDTVPDAGKYDGILGVLLAVEVVRRLKDVQSELPFALEVVAFADEEGTRFGATLLGSCALAGTWHPEWWELSGDDGVTMRQAFERFGLDPERIHEAARSSQELVGYLEAHIEQGPYLEAAARPLGVVTSIAGARRFRISVIGEARHAGGTPYSKRQDALVGASRAVLDIESIGRQNGAIATVGQMEVHPGAVNVVPGRADFSLDLRAETDQLRDAAWEKIQDSMHSFCSERELQIEVEEIHSAPTVYCDSRLTEAVRHGIRATGDEQPMEMFSRAGHDAMAVAAVTGVAMLFTRCEDGISHHPDENVTTADVAYALDSLEASVRAIAQRFTEDTQEEVTA